MKALRLPFLVFVALVTTASADLIAPSEGDILAESFYVRVSRFKPAPQAVHMPSIKKQPLPEYPIEMRLAKMQGGVIVRFELESDGRVKKWEITKDVVPGFADAVKSAVAEWRFGSPKDYAGKAVPLTIDYEILFLLR